MFKINEKSKSFSKKRKLLTKEIKDIDNKMEILELQNIIIKIKNSINGLNIRMKRTEEGISEPKDRTTEMTQNEKKREKRVGVGEKSRASGSCGTLTEDLTFMPLTSQKGEEKDGRTDKVLQEIMAEIPQIWQKDIYFLYSRG